MIKQLKTTAKHKNSKNVQIADITLEKDSSIWKKTIKTDSVKWKQFWGLGGIMNSAIRDMGVKSAPYFIVTDSAGTALYRGPSLDAACAAVDEKLK